MSRGLPPEVRASLALAPGTAVRRLAGRHGVWRVDLPAAPFVLRRNDPTAHPPSEATVVDDVGWVHRHLERLATTGFPAARPVPRLGADSVAVLAGAVWETVSYQPGRVAGWSTRPTMGTLGGFLAELHTATDGLAVDGQRAPSWPLETILDDRGSVEARLPVEDRRAFAAAADRLDEGLAAIDHTHLPRSVIHGDLTNHNVIVGGSPVAPVGVIDFANAYVEATLADLAFALWRSGRPRQDADTFDVGRIAAYVAGYHARRPLAAEDVRTVVVHLRGRGIQIVVKQAQRAPDRPVDRGPLAKLAGLDSIESQLLDALVRVVG